MDSNSPDKRQAIVADGRDRALKGSSETVSQQCREIATSIEKKYALRLASSGLLKRAWLRIKMKREIARETGRAKEAVAPRDGLYLENSGR